MMRLSGLAGSRPCSTRRCLRTPLISICRLPSPSGDGPGQRPAVADAEILDRAQRRAGGPADVVGPALQPVELLDDRERDHDVAPVEGRGRSRGRRSGPRCRATIRVRWPAALTSLPILGATGASETTGRRSVTATPRRSGRGRGNRGRSDSVPNGCLLYCTTRGARGWRAVFTRPSSTGHTGAVAPHLPVLRHRRRRRRPPRSSTATTSPSRSSTARRCSPATCWSCRGARRDAARARRRGPVLRAGPAGGRGDARARSGAQGTFVANNNVVSQSVAHLHVHVVPAHEGRRAARVLLAPPQVRRRRGRGGRGQLRDALDQER